MSILTKQKDPASGWAVHWLVGQNSYHLRPVFCQVRCELVDYTGIFLSLHSPHIATKPVYVYFQKRVKPKKEKRKKVKIS